MIRAIRSRRPLLLAALIVVGGCSGGGGTQDDTAAARNFTPPAMATPSPLPGQAHDQPIAAYVGRYPNDAVGGVTFFDRSEVAAALNRAVGDQRVRQTMLERTGVASPIFRDAQGRIAAAGCEPHNCADHNWTLFVAATPASSAACYHDARTMGATSRWYAGAAPVVRPGACPSDASNDAA